MASVEKHVFDGNYQRYLDVEGKTTFCFFICKTAGSEEFKEMHGSCIYKDPSGITLGRLWGDFGLALAVVGNPWGPPGAPWVPRSPCGSPIGY